MSREQRKIATAFLEQLRQLSKRHPGNNRDGFDEEMDELRAVDHRVRSNVDEFYTASLATSVAKNRFTEVRANEGTRVRLRSLVEENQESYINANYVDGRALFNVPFTYIATQAPLKNTIFDFWRMVFENDVVFVVMLCGEVEDGKAKSEMYWPKENGVLDIGILQISSIGERRLSDLVFRSFILHNANGEEHQVYHMQYIGWPDQGIPDTSAPLMEIIQTMGKSELSVQTPIVVHCSGGIGRTGVFIALHVALAQFQLERKDIDIKRIVHILKLSRTGMVQRKDQYVFLYYSVQREMDRMIMSAEKGVSLLELLRRREPTASRQTAPRPVTNTTPQSPVFSSQAAWTTTKVPQQFATPIPTQAYPHHQSQSRELGPMPRRNFPYASPHSFSAITEGEQRLLEDYLKRQTPSSQQLVALPRDPVLKLGKETTTKKVPNMSVLATQKESHTGIPNSTTNTEALEEQLQHWQWRNREMRFSTDRVERREREAATRQAPEAGTKNESAPSKRPSEEKPSKMEALVEPGPTPEEVQNPFSSTRGASTFSERSAPPVSIIITPQEAGTARNSDPTFHAGSGNSPTNGSYSVGNDSEQHGHSVATPEKATALTAATAPPATTETKSATAPGDPAEESEASRFDRLGEALADFETLGPFPRRPRTHIIAKEEFDRL
ncbi:putative tyrosine specific protein phosphatase [Trypanosoma cruzi]|uniref:Tyrosine specific protein phosphatase, putative n=2 Tax=Trypanosoma cruzi TaxID=5693 RepID=Q4DCU3_TRYCC|nr:tyrosine specific protein phosphatase, putative [Trypanosoma cruzi]EAN90345.1 tyrosine specific protein phosphatase, putative [Trypanosoma cruzi]PWV17205.1 putative tyrosine specific protein phosphatase [Trypanosoma cruzi]|eukprot:XP_812196.1 tyrosine specific protein phosphatase [Trypanosoma cruzi strain CL Brener]